jgi:uncharacterized protein
VDSPGPAADPAIDVRTRLRWALRGALRARDMIAVSALRSVLSAIGNAEAVDPGPAVAAGTAGPHFASAASGLGATEAARRGLSAAEVDGIVRAEVSERQRAARAYERSGHADQAERLRAEARVLISAAAGEYRPLA